MTDWTTTKGRTGQRGFGNWTVTDENRLPADFCYKCLEQGCHCQSLQHLREEFEAARLAVDQLPRENLIFSRRGKVHRYEWMEDIERCATAFSGQTPAWHDPDKDYLGKVLLAARRYVIARDFNEFDPGKADMLWKLQNGGSL